MAIGRDHTSARRRWGRTAIAATATVAAGLVAAPAAADTPVVVTTMDQLSNALYSGNLTPSVQLGADITFGDAFDAIPDQAITIDLHGHSLQVPGDTSGVPHPTVDLSQGSSLTIEDTVGGGSFTTSNPGSLSCPPIGGPGHLTVAGGTVTATAATGSVDAPAIGQGFGCNDAFGGLTVTGGTVIATGGVAGPGIGNVQASSMFPVTITGGSVIATGGEAAPGIGVAFSGPDDQNVSGPISISGGTVHATGGAGGAGIGTGLGPGYTPTVTISGGTVVATGGTSAAGIGGGGGDLPPNSQPLRGWDGVPLTITGGTVTATGGSRAPGIGGGAGSVGEPGGSGGTVSIGAAASVTATGQDGASAIGAGLSGAGFTGTEPSFGTLTNAGTLTVPAGADLDVPVGATATNTATGTIIDKGTITGGGVVANAGAIVTTDGGSVAGNGQSAPQVTGNNTALSFDTSSTPSAPSPAPNAPAGLQVFAAAVAASQQTLPAVTGTATAAFAGWYTQAAGGDAVTDTTTLPTAGQGPVGETLFAHYVAPPTFTTSAPDAVYGGTYEPAAISPGSQVAITVEPHSADVCDIDQTGTVHFTAVGVCALVASVVGTSVPVTVTQKVTVSPATLTVAPDHQTVLFGAPLPALSYHVDGFALGDTAASALTGAATCSTSATPGSPGGDYPITCDPATLTAPGGDYTLTFSPGTLTVDYSEPCLTGLQVGPTTVAAGDALCVGPHAILLGPVRVANGGALDLESATVVGPVFADGPTALRVCASQVVGPLRVTAATTAVTVGDPAHECAGNLLGPTVVTGNPGPVTLTGNTVFGRLAVSGNTGPVEDRSNTVHGHARLQ